ncbi:hypothetical protein [uncultured Tateyamaria sp.]|uniref:hypothetical protein n=1 Tax=Tateyamaria sp. 1078 TaxID=3417464 RepID=UPI0026263BA0|nr:hypothetical protein [uncultured Tateyamaria sp.]
MKVITVDATQPDIQDKHEEQDRHDGLGLRMQSVTRFCSPRASLCSKLVLNSVFPKLGVNHETRFSMLKIAAYGRPKT